MQFIGLAIAFSVLVLVVFLFASRILLAERWLLVMVM